GECRAGDESGSSLGTVPRVGAEGLGTGATQGSFSRRSGPGAGGGAPEALGGNDSPGRPRREIARCLADLLSDRLYLAVICAFGPGGGNAGRGCPQGNAYAPDGHHGCEYLGTEASSRAVSRTVAPSRGGTGCFRCRRGNQAAGRGGEVVSGRKGESTRRP